MKELCLKTNEEAISTVCNDVGGVRYCKLTIQRNEVCVPITTDMWEAFERLKKVLEGLGMKR